MATKMKINGLPVVDATKPLPLYIGKNDVRLGATKDPASCAAARALCRKKGIQQARVHIGRTYVLVGKKWIRYLTPDSLRAEIVSFDRGGSLVGGFFRLAAMARSKRTGKRQGTARTGGRGKKRAKYHITTGVRQWGANR